MILAEYSILQSHFMFAFALSTSDIISSGIIGVSGGVFSVSTLRNLRRVELVRCVYMCALESRKNDTQINILLV